MNSRYRRLTVDRTKTIKHVLATMNRLNRKALVISSTGEYGGIISIGDIQRALLSDHGLDTEVGEICRPVAETTYAHVGDSMETLKNRMMRERIELMPIVDGAMDLYDILVWDSLFEGTIAPDKDQLLLPVVIMAGGIGTRLSPLTRIIPKALVPVFEKPIILEILDRFRDQGVSRFYLSVNYKAEMIKSFLRELDDSACQMEFLEEIDARGSAGSLDLLAGTITETFIVTNCDIILDQDYAEILEYHVRSGNKVTIVGALKSFDMPYGILHTGEGGALQRIEEKPERSHLVNTGFYVLEPDALSLIPPCGVFHMTNLIEAAMARGMAVGVFPVNENEWLDMGDWNEHDRMRNKLMRYS